MGHGSIRGREFLWHHQHTLQFLEARQVLVDVFDEAFIQRLYLGVRNQCLSRSEFNLVLPCPLFQHGEVRRDQHRGEFSAVAEHHRGAAGAAAAGMAAGPNFANLQAAVADPKAIVRTVATAAGYKIEESGDAMQITIPVGPLRKQRVTVEFGQKDADGNAIVNYWSICGPFEEKNAAALLQYNTSTIHGAFAVKTIADKQMVVLQTNQPADTISALEVSKVLAAIAWQADQVEQKLIGTDEN